jgi:mono/diheme cytochrome c family protein
MPLNGPSIGFPLLQRSTQLRGAASMLGLSVVAALSGCQLSEPEEIVVFEPNYVHAAKLEIQEELPTEQALRDVSVLLEEWFGTPDQPRLPGFLISAGADQLISEANLEMAAGPGIDGDVPGDRGIYRQFCITCHGVTGQGRGPLAASQNPYPRDFRHGTFKYKRTARSQKPLKSDLHRTLRQGLAGSQMPVYKQFSDAQVEAVTDYVIYLSLRGELERQILSTAAFELALDKGERVYDPKEADQDEGWFYSHQERQQLWQDAAEEILLSWLDAQDAEEEIELPSELPVHGLTDGDFSRQELLASIEQGRQLFNSEVAACSKCHGTKGDGKGSQEPDYDDWTKDWTKNIGIEPTDLASLQPLLVLGALRPQPLLPRSLTEGLFRGGSDPIDLYLRARHGIAGSTMPAASIASSPGAPGLSEDDLWHLVNYVRYLGGLVPDQEDG